LKDYSNFLYDNNENKNSFDTNYGSNNNNKNENNTVANGDISEEQKTLHQTTSLGK